MTTKVSFFLCLPLLLPGARVTLADSSLSHGAAVVNACAACHGPDGQGKGAIPSFNTLPKGSIVETLRAFRSGERQGTVMNRIAKGLDDADIEAIAAYTSKAHQRP